MIVSAPASSANLGPGFDCLGMALDLPFEMATGEQPAEGWLAVEQSHPAAVAFVAGSGDPDEPLWWRSPIPPGRGLGFSGAARVAGAYLALRHGDGERPGHDPAVAAARRIAADLEGHADNAAASALGGITVAVDDTVIGLDAPEGLEVLVWWPDAATSTRQSRGALGDTVKLRDAAFSIGRAALWVAALGSGDFAALRTACEDRVHQPERLAARPDAAQALEALLGRSEVLAAWLSGSGPTVAALVESTDGVGGGEVAALAAGLPAGRTRRLAIARRGVHVVG